MRHLNGALRAGRWVVDLDTRELGTQLKERKQDLMDNPELLEQATAAARRSKPGADSQARSQR